MKKNLIFSFILMTLSLQTGCLYAVRYDGPYQGKVVDEQTREPIEGAVVLGTWSVVHFTPAGGVHTYYDARETITDRNGEFTISGQGLRIMSSLEPMSVMIFKSGYRHFGSVAWNSLKIAYRDEIKWEEDMAIFPVKKMTLEERKIAGTPSRPNIPTAKMKLMTGEINKDRVERGLGKL